MQGGHREALRCTSGLGLHASEGESHTLGLHHAGGLAIHVQEVVGLAVPRLERKLAHGNTLTGIQVQATHVLHSPAGQGEKVVVPSTDVEVDPRRSHLPARNLSPLFRAARKPAMNWRFTSTRSANSLTVSPGSLASAVSRSWAMVDFAIRFDGMRGYP